VAAEDEIRMVFNEMDGEQISLLGHYAALLAKWNAKINLISRKDVGNIVCKHIIPCLSIGRVADFLPGETVLDIGTGGGLPGIPLAIAHRTTNFTLMDSVGKKIGALNEMISELGLRNTKLVHCRAENFSGKFDKIVARAVSNLRKFLGYSSKLLKRDGKIFYIKGGDCSGDFALLKKYKLHSISAATGIDKLGDKVILEIF
jgi:16S rRNA (guanine527-N7)-methyltransferase